MIGNQTGSSLVVCMFLVIALAAQARAGDRPTGMMHATRSVVVAGNGMVATSQPLAVQVGVDILKRGGAAVDAAIAVNAMLGLVEPMSCGIGGDLFALVWDAKTNRLYGLNASGRSPYSLSREIFRAKGLDGIPVRGPLSWSVPGCVDGWFELHRRFGRLAMKDLLGPAVEYAGEGFPVSQVIAHYWRGAEAGRKDMPNFAATYLPGGRAPREGEIFRNPDLAQTYTKIASEVRDAFYKDEIAKSIVAFSERYGGYFSMRDFEVHTSTWVAPVSTSYRGYDVWELPPNGQGIAALQMLNILEGFDLESLVHNSADYLHLLIEAKKLVFEDRAKFYADPDFNKLPVAELISKTYAERRRALIDMSRAQRKIEAGDPKLEGGDTVYLTTADKDGNMVSFIQSNYYGFGSGMVPDGLGFVLQNRGALFSLDPAHFNSLEPGKRPFHTVIPAFVTKDGKPWFSFGVMGGDMQPQGHVQVLCNIIDFGMNIQEAGDAPRFRHFGSSTPTGRRMSPGGGTVALENGISAEVRRELARRGHRIVHSNGGFGGYQGILIDLGNGAYHGASESRKDGCAMGY